MASAIIPSDGPPTQVTIGGAVYYILRMGITVPTSVLSKDLIERYGLTWDHDPDPGAKQGPWDLFSKRVHRPSVRIRGEWRRKLQRARGKAGGRRDGGSRTRRPCEGHQGVCPRAHDLRETRVGRRVERNGKRWFPSGQRERRAHKAACSHAPGCSLARGADAERLLAETHAARLTKGMA